MDATRFHNALRVLLNLEPDDLRNAGVVDENWGTIEASTRDQLRDFIGNPIREALRMPDANFNRLFALIEKRQRVKDDRPRILAALKVAERFIRGFEGDPLQEGIDEMLAQINAALEGDEPPAADYLVWSNEHRAWWGPKSCGYTTHLSEAGRYSREEARSIARNARDGWREGAPPPEIAVRADDAEFCLAGAYLPPFKPTVRFYDGEDRSGECAP